LTAYARGSRRGWMVGSSPRLSGLAFCCSYTKVQKSPAQPFVSLGRAVLAIHAFLWPDGSGIRHVGGRDEPGQGGFRIVPPRRARTEFAAWGAMGSPRR